LTPLAGTDYPRNHRRKKRARVLAFLFWENGST